MVFFEPDVQPERKFLQRLQTKGGGHLDRKLRSQTDSVFSVIKSCQAKLISSADRVTMLVDEGNGVCPRH